MALTSERYIPDDGSVVIDGTEMNGSVKTVNYNPPRRAQRKATSLGGNVTEVQDQDKAGDFEVTLEVFDDRSKLEASADSVMKTLWTAYYTNTALTSLVVSPAGITVGMTGYTFGTTEVVQCPPHAPMDSDTEEEGLASVVVITDTITPAAIV